jgi:hypothetical protein
MSNQQVSMKNYQKETTRKFSVQDKATVPKKKNHLILVSSSASSLLQPCVQPENASISIS